MLLLDADDEKAGLRRDEGQEGPTSSCSAWTALIWRGLVLGWIRTVWATGGTLGHTQKASGSQCGYGQNEMSAKCLLCATSLLPILVSPRWGPMRRVTPLLLLLLLLAGFYLPGMHACMLSRRGGAK